MTGFRILKQGENCWRVCHAGRLSVLVDGNDYFSAVRAAIKRARRSIWIVGWDIDGRLRLERDGTGDLPEQLCALLCEVLRRNRKLRVYILTWDFAMIYALEREWIPIFRLAWRKHRRLRFFMDGRHPFGASQHQKLVVIDDSVAFCGGLDLTKCRWDTPEHRPADPRRVDPDGAPYEPFHDVQMLVDGHAAAALGELARERWRRATGERRLPGRYDGSTGDPWPEGIAPDITNADVAIARTYPAYREWSEVREVERLYIDSIAAAERNIYIECQYLTSHVIGDALTERLQESSGPDIVIVTTLLTQGWLEQHTMDVLRARLLRRLRAADRYSRLRVCYPQVPGVAGEGVKVHSKLMVIDDRLLRVGSSNLSNRSMGLDTECDLAVEAIDGDQRQRVATVRDRLLAEHLGTSPEEIARSMAQTNSLIATLRRFSESERTLRPLDGEVPDEIDRQVPASAVIDPEKSIDPADLAAEFLEPRDVEPAGRNIAVPVAVLAVALVLAAAWRWTPLGEWLRPETMQATLDSIAAMKFAPLLVIAAYVIGGLLVIPVSVLIVATGLAFGPMIGGLYAFLGALASAAVTYGVGYMTGRDFIRRVAGPRVNELSKRLAQRGILAMIALRIVPVAPFTIINLVAGASHISFRDYLIGNAIGLLPGIIAIVAFVDRVMAALNNPGWIEFLILGAVLMAIAIAIWALRKWVHRTVGPADDGAARG